MSEKKLPGPLTDEQIRFFREQGYVVVPGLFTKAEMGPITGWVEEVEAWPETPGKWMMYFENTDDDQRLPVFRLTRFGREVFSLCQADADTAYLLAVASELKKRGFTIRLGDWMGDGVQGLFAERMAV